VKAKQYQARVELRVLLRDFGFAGVRYVAAFADQGKTCVKVASRCNARYRVRGPTRVAVADGRIPARSLIPLMSIKTAG